MGSETFTLQLNGVDADVDQNLRPIVCAQADGVEGRRDKYDDAVDGRGEVARDRGDRKAWAMCLPANTGSGTSAISMILPETGAAMVRGVALRRLRKMDMSTPFSRRFRVGR